MIVTKYISIALLAALALSTPNIANASPCSAKMALALNIYHEAKGESLEGKLMVAEVVMNRVEDKRFPKTICEVVYDKGQFEWVSKNLSVKEPEVFENIVELSGEILDGEVDLPGTEALFFKSKGYKSAFHSKRVFLGTVGNHEFYK